MTDFEKALEEKAIKHSSQYDQIGQSVFEAAEFDFKACAHWAREFTVREIIKLLKIKDSIWCDCIEDIESHFKDRGGEK